MDLLGILLLLLCNPLASSVGASAAPDGLDVSTLPTAPDLAELMVITSIHFRDQTSFDKAVKEKSWHQTNADPSTYWSNELKEINELDATIISYAYTDAQLTGRSSSNGTEDHHKRKRIVGIVGATTGGGLVVGGLGGAWWKFQHKPKLSGVNIASVKPPSPDKIVPDAIVPPAKTLADEVGKHCGTIDSGQVARPPPSTLSPSGTTKKPSGAAPNPGAEPPVPNSQPEPAGPPKDRPVADAPKPEPQSPANAPQPPPADAPKSPVDAPKPQIDQPKAARPENWEVPLKFHDETTDQRQWETRMQDEWQKYDDASQNAQSKPGDGGKTPPGQQEGKPIEDGKPPPRQPDGQQNEPSPKSNNDSKPPPGQQESKLNDQVPKPNEDGKPPPGQPDGQQNGPPKPDDDRRLSTDQGKKPQPADSPKQPDNTNNGGKPQPGEPQNPPGDRPGTPRPDDIPKDSPKAVKPDSDSPGNAPGSQEQKPPPGSGDKPPPEAKPPGSSPDSQGQGPPRGSGDKPPSPGPQGQNGQKPPPANGDRPLSVKEEKPPSPGSQGQNSPGSGQQPPSGNGERPPSVNGNKPPPSSGEKPLPGSGERPPSVNGEKPPPENGDKPPSVNGDKPPPADGRKPPPANGDKPPSVNGDKPQPANGGKPSPANEERPPPGRGEKPPPGNEGKPPSVNEEKPRPGSGDKPPPPREVPDSPPRAQGQQNPPKTPDRPLTDGNVKPNDLAKKADELTKMANDLKTEFEKSKQTYQKLQEESINVPAKDKAAHSAKADKELMRAKGLMEASDHAEEVAKAARLKAAPPNSPKIPVPDDFVPPKDVVKEAADLRAEVERLKKSVRKLENEALHASPTEKHGAIQKFKWEKKKLNDVSQASFHADDVAELAQGRMKPPVWHPDGLMRPADAMSVLDQQEGKSLAELADIYGDPDVPGSPRNPVVADAGNDPSQFGGQFGQIDGAAADEAADAVVKGDAAGQGSPKLKSGFSKWWQKVKDAFSGKGLGKAAQGGKGAAAGAVNGASGGGKVARITLNFGEVKKVFHKLKAGIDRIRNAKHAMQYAAGKPFRMGIDWLLNTRLVRLAKSHIGRLLRRFVPKWILNNLRWASPVLFLIMLWWDLTEMWQIIYCAIESKEMEKKYGEPMGRKWDVTDLHPVCAQWAQITLDLAPFIMTGVAMLSDPHAMANPIDTYKDLNAEAESLGLLDGKHANGRPNRTTVEAENKRKEKEKPNENSDPTQRGETVLDLHREGAGELLHPRAVYLPLWENPTVMRTSWKRIGE